MAANASIPPLRLAGPHDDPDHYEFIRGRWLKKESVGREGHSELEELVSSLLKPMAKRLGSKVLIEWTIAHNQEKFIPDVTFSFPDRQVMDGYLVAPPLLVVETLSEGQRINALFEKCFEDYHRIGTPYCWILDPQTQTAYECHRETNGATPAVKQLTAGPGITLSVADLGWR